MMINGDCRREVRTKRAAGTREGGKGNGRLQGERVGDIYAPEERFGESGREGRGVRIGVPAKSKFKFFLPAKKKKKIQIYFSRGSFFFFFLQDLWVL